jgi:hypothetical protein
MSINRTNRIALISVTGDPAAEISQEEAGGQNVYVRQVGLGISKSRLVGGYVYRRLNARSIISCATLSYRTIRLTAGALGFISRDQVFGYLPRVCGNKCRHFKNKKDIFIP